VREVKVTKISQVVNSERERYVLEGLALCPEDGGASKKSKKSKKSTPQKGEDE
jgi:hypothetical protein